MLTTLANLENKAYIANGNMLLVNTHRQSGLPDEYTLVDGIKDASTSTPILTTISTGIIDDVDDMEYEVYFKCGSLGSWSILSSGITGGGSGSRAHGIKWSSSNSTTNGISAYAGRSPALLTSDIKRSASTSSRDYKYLIKFIHKQGNASLYVFDEYRNSEDTKTATYNNYREATDPICLFTSGGYDSVTAKNDTIYYIKIKKSGNLVADYISCIYNNTAGFYDTVSQTFKTISSGSVVAGDELPDPYII